MRPDSAVAPLQPLPIRGVAPRAASTAFLLSGGAGLGAPQVGMLRALYE